MGTEKRIFVLDTDPPMVTISGKPRQEQERSEKTVLRLIAYDRKVHSNIEVKYLALKAEFFVEK